MKLNANRHVDRLMNNHCVIKHIQIYFKGVFLLLINFSFQFSWKETLTKWSSMESNSYENWDEIDMFFGHLVIGNWHFVIGICDWQFVIGSFRIEFGMVWCGLEWFDMVWYGLVRFGTVWYGLVQFGMDWYGLVRFGMVWYSLVWFGMFWVFRVRGGGWVCL